MLKVLYYYFVAIFIGILAAQLTSFVISSIVKYRYSLHHKVNICSLPEAILLPSPWDWYYLVAEVTLSIVCLIYAFSLCKKNRGK